MTTEDRLQQIERELSPFRDSLLNHPIYAEIDHIDNLHRFMQHHVFAVWDFMSLLKALQYQICGARLPWLPPADPMVARFVNEIVLGEETDCDGDGGFTSHFELYHRAMQSCGVDTGQIDRFLDEIRMGHPVETALAACRAPESVQQFVNHTFAVIGRGDLCEIAAAFTFGREDLLPDVFQRIIDELNAEIGGGLDAFQYYLSRHVELDGDHHGPMAARMIAWICGDDDAKWQLATDAAIESLRARIRLWDGMLAPRPRAMPVRAGLR